MALDEVQLIMNDINYYRNIDAPPDMHKTPSYKARATEGKSYDLGIVVPQSTLSYEKFQVPSLALIPVS